MTSYYQNGPSTIDTRTTENKTTNTTLYTSPNKSSSPTIEPSAVFYALGNAFLIIGISSLVIFHFGIISACIIIALGAEIMKAVQRDPKEIFENRECCGSLHATAIAAIVMASLELAASLILATIFININYDDRVRANTGFPYNTCPSGYCSCNFYYFSTSFFYSDSFQWYNFGATIFDSIIKISFCSVFLHLSKSKSNQGDSYSQRFIKTIQSTLLDTGYVLYALGALMLSIGIITLIIINIGFISSCILIIIGDTFMKASTSATDNKNLTERRGLFSINGSAIAGIVMTSIEFVISIILLATSYTQKVPASAIFSSYNCQYTHCEVIKSLYQFADFCSYNLGVSLITTVTKILLFCFTMRLTKIQQESDDIYEQQQLSRPIEAKEGSALLAAVNNQKRVETALIGVRSSVL